ncbi:serine/threonine protein kinase [Frankia sp. R43]|uniref:serine/threonine-protein kinase n=1 Tax=Frankia sp. R43 TaxID=269536 RepID=UPI0006CA5D01|nr:serine/threonine-protein kinase [Frankia sp. R43]KPM53125.1 serine/threonine protein kinase [Frankia sp. R43]
MTETGVLVQEPRPGDPEVLGRHRVLGRLGAGGMGVVYLAEGPFGRVAVKLVRAELADDADFRRRFQREVQACFRVGGARTARLVDFELTADRPWLATEFFDAPNLAEQVRADGPLAADAQLVLAAGLAEALLSIHTTGLVHRDLKPSNVLWTPSGPKVIDFGIAAVTDTVALTSTGHFVGTPGWHSPEQISGQEVTAAADIFAWGALLCYAASGKAPFGTGSPEVVLARVAVAEPVVDRELIAPALRDLVTTAMIRDPASRPTAVDLYEALVGLVPSDAAFPVTRVLGANLADTPPSTPVRATWTDQPSADQPARESVPPAAPPATGPSGPSGARRLVAVLAVLLIAAVGGIIGLVLTQKDDTGSPAESAESAEPADSADSAESAEFTAGEPWRITIDDQIEGNDDTGCTVTVLDADGAVVQLFEGVYSRKAYQVADTGVFHWTVNNDGCLVSADESPAKTGLPFVQMAYSGDTSVFDTSGRISVDPIDFGDATDCELTLRAIDGRSLDFVTAHKGDGPVVLNAGGPDKVYLAEAGCAFRVSVQS